MAATWMRSPLGRAVGLGSAKERVEHWWLQRITAVALVPLSFWFVVAIIQPVRRRERKMQRFKSARSAQRFGAAGRSRPCGRGARSRQAAVDPPSR
jgi:hypothetical protein